MYCTNCGTKIVPGEAYCRNCGTPADSNKDGAPPVKGGGRSALIIVGGAVVGLALAALLTLVVLPALGIFGDKEVQSSSVTGSVLQTGDNSAGSASIAGNNSAGSTPVSGEGGSSSEVEQTTPPVFTNATASSELEPDQYTSYYGPLNVIDGNTVTGWNEGSAGDGTGEWVELSAGSEQVVKGVRIMTGYAKNEGVYYRNNRPTQVTITLSDGYSTTANLTDEFSTWSDVSFDKAHKTTSVKITVDAVAAGSKWNDAAISEVEAY